MPSQGHSERYEETYAAVVRWVLDYHDRLPLQLGMTLAKYQDFPSSCYT